jgi:hypothetical protein
MVRCKENISKGCRVTNGFGNKIFRRTLPFLMIGMTLIGMFSVAVGADWVIWEVAFRNPSETQAFGKQVHNPMDITEPRLYVRVEDALLAEVEIKGDEAVIGDLFGDDIDKSSPKLNIIPPQILAPVEDALVAEAEIMVLTAVLCLNCQCFGKDFG